jgi:hypothetical protein
MKTFVDENRTTDAYFWHYVILRIKVLLAASGGDGSRVPGKP